MSACLTFCVFSACAHVKHVSAMVFYAYIVALHCKAAFFSVCVCERILQACQGSVKTAAVIKFLSGLF